MTAAQIRKRLERSLADMDQAIEREAGKRFFSREAYASGWLRGTVEDLIRDLTPAPRARKKAVTP